MERARAVVCGLARDIEAFFPYTRSRIQRLTEMFADVKIILYENDSGDSTPELLASWARSDSRILLLSERLGKRRWPSIRDHDRGTDMATYRNRYLEAARELGRGFEYLIVLDTDLPHGFSYDGLAHTFGHQDWDMVGSNGVQLRWREDGTTYLAQFDGWAFRDVDHPEPHDPMDVNPRSYSRGQERVPVWSCFGGLAVYRMASLPAGVSYEGNDCEHVKLHLNMRSRGFGRMFLNPSQIVIYPPRPPSSGNMEAVS